LALLNFFINRFLRKKIIFFYFGPSKFFYK
jgi:hypothetical protein